MPNFHSKTGALTLLIMGAGVMLMTATLTACSHGLEEVHMEDRPLDKPLVINMKPRPLAIGSGFSVGIKKDGTVWTWGNNYEGNLARPIKTFDDRYEPGQVPGLSNAVSVSASENVLVLTKDGAVWSWGPNDHRQLGYDLEEDKSFHASDPPDIPRKIPGLPRMVSVVMAGYMGVGLSEDGVIWAWGAGGKNSLFDIDGGVPDKRPPTPIEGLPFIQKISATETVIAAIDKSGNLWTVGHRIESGRRLSKDAPPKTLIGQVPFHRKVVDVDIQGSASAAIALLENGEVWTWGVNYAGQLGQGHRRDIYSPQRVMALSRIKLVSNSLDNMAAVSNDGGLLYWGNLIHGKSPEPIVSTKLSIDSPIKIKEGISAMDLVSHSATLAYLDDRGQAWYSGWNRKGERGTGERRDDVPMDYILMPEMSHWSR